MFIFSLLSSGLDAFPYSARIEAETARRNIIYPQGEARLDGAGNLLLDSATDYLYTQNSTNNKLDTDKFTFRNDIVFSSVSSDMAIIGGTTADWLLRAELDGQATISKMRIYLAGAMYEWPFTPTIGVTYRTMVIRDVDDSLTFYVNEVQTGTIYNSVDDVPTNARMQVGRSNGGNDNFIGTMAYCEVSRDLVRLVQAATYPANTRNRIRLEFDGPLNSRRILDGTLPDGVLISFLEDTSGFDFDATQPNQVNQPLQDGGVPFSRFDGVDDAAIVNVDFIQKQSFTIYLVAYVFDDQPFDVYLLDTIDARMKILDDGSFSINAGTELVAPGYYFEQYHVFAAVFNGGSSQLYVDGVLKTTGDAGTNGMPKLVVGTEDDKDFSPHMNFQGLFVEPGTYNATLNSQIMAKYGITP